MFIDDIKAFSIGCFVVTICIILLIITGSLCLKDCGATQPKQSCPVRK